MMSIVYGAVSKLYFDDNFARSAGAIGANYQVEHTTTTADMQVSAGQEAVYNGTTGGTQAAIYIQPMNTDKIAVEIQVTSSIAAASGVKGTLVFIGNATGTAVCAMRITTTTVAILTGAYGALTSRASHTQTNSNGNFFQLSYDPATNIYTAMNTSTAVGVTFTDSTNIMSHGAANRYGGMGVGYASGVGGNIGYFQTKDL